MSQDKANPQALQPQSQAIELTLETQRKALLEGQERPSLRAALESEDQQEDTMRPLPSREDLGPAKIPGIHLMTGILSGESTPEELALWQTQYAKNPKAQKRLAQLRQWALQSPHSQDDAWEAELAREQTKLLKRGNQLLQQMPALPADFWESQAAPTQEPPTAQTHDPDTNEIMQVVQSTPWGEAALASDEPAMFDASDSAARRSSQTAVSLDEPALASARPASTNPGWGDWLRWGTPALLTLCWFAFQPPSYQAPSKNIDEANPWTGPTIYRPNPSIAHPKGRYPLAPVTPGPTTPTFSMALHLRRQGTMHKMPARFVAQTGDQARFLFKQSGTKSHYLTLFLAEQNGRVSYLYPSRKERRYKLHTHTKARYLPGGISLSTPQHPERIFACVSKQPISWQQVTRTTRSSTRNHSLVRLASLPLPCVYQVSWLMMPPPQ